MVQRFNLFNIFVGFVTLTAINFLYPLSARTEELLRFQLNQELKKGNFFIGLKQHLGGQDDNFSINNNITFETDKKFLSLYSLNGIKHKSKKINIILKEIPTNVPLRIERFVLGPYSSYESAEKQANRLKERGFDSTIAYPKNWEVWIPITENLPQNEFEYKIVKKTLKTQISPFLNSEYTSQKLEGPIYISSEEDIKINSINYGKQFYLIQDSYGTWTLIQKIKFDNYLEGVLPHEIGSNSPLEALKAQAVIARTWGIYNSARFRMDKYHLCVTTQCQVYKPPKFENLKVKKAIKETTNLIVTYKNKPINSFYHGSNGGISAMASESWKINDYPYLQTKIDAIKFPETFIKIPIKDQSDLSNFLDFEKDQFYGDYHPFFRWKKKISNKTIENILIKKKNISTSENIYDLKVRERGLSGRVTKLEIQLLNSNKNFVLFKDDIRRIFSFLPSNLFTIDKLNDNLWFFKGGGFGHGVGLSQSGAIEMAKLGFTYEQILNHYYRGTKLKSIETSSQ